MFPWLHPSVVHFAVALVFAGVMFDVVALWRSSERLVLAGFWNTLLGALGLVAALVTGLVAQAQLGAHDPLGDALLSLHRTFAYAATVLAVALVAVRLAMRGSIRPRTRTLYLAGAFVTAAFVLACGGLGGTLVYRYGLGIGPAAAHAVLDAQPKATAAQPH